MLHVAFILKQLIYAQNTFVAHTDLGPNESKANCKFLISLQAKKRCPRPLEKLPPLKKGAVGRWTPSHRTKLKTNWPAGRLFSTMLTLGLSIINVKHGSKYLYPIFYMHCYICRSKFELSFFSISILSTAIF